MKWYVKETSVENTVCDFGPFEKITDAAFFVHQHQMKWSEDFLSKIEIIKVSDSFQINPNIYTGV